MWFFGNITAQSFTDVVYISASFSPIAGSYCRKNYSDTRRLASLGIMGEIIDGPPETPLTSRHYGTEGFITGTQICREACSSRTTDVFFFQPGEIYYQLKKLYIFFYVWKILALTADKISTKNDASFRAVTEIIAN